MNKTRRATAQTSAPIATRTSAVSTPATHVVVPKPGHTVVVVAPAAPVVVLPRGPLHVQAIRPCFYDGGRRRIGEVFTLSDHTQFNARDMTVVLE